MKILTRYIISSILKVAIIAILMFALILAAVELFSRMDAIMNDSIPALSIIYYLLLSIPQYLLMVASISFLFAVTYFLSSLTANNELIPILNAGVSPARLKFPIIVLAGVLTILGSVFQEEAVIRINSRRDVVEAELFGSSSTRDYRNLVLDRLAWCETQPGRYPTVKRTIEEISVNHRIKPDDVRNTINSLIKDGYLTERSIVMRGSERRAVLFVDWGLLSSDGIYEKPADNILRGMNIRREADKR